MINTKKSKNIYGLLFNYSIIPLTIIIILLQISNPLSSFIEEDLGGHMIIEHSLFFLFGYSAIFSLQKCNRYFAKLGLLFTCILKNNNLKWNRLKKNGRYGWIFIIVIFLLFWHIPVVFDYASYYVMVHLLQHISFIIVGMCIYMVIKKFEFNFHLILLLLMGSIMGLSGLLLILSITPVYSFYTIQSHISAGNYMIIFSIMMMIFVLPTILIKKALTYLKNNEYDF